jgi:glyoxylase I family protein
MQIEHFAFQSMDPVAMAAWYVEHLGMRVVKALGAPTHTHFLEGSDGTVQIEFYRNENAPLPDYPRQDPLVVHLAFVSDDPATDADRLIAAGAFLQSKATTTPAGDTLVMLRDPWGFPIQLCRRSKR